MEVSAPGTLAISLKSGLTWVGRCLPATGKQGEYQPILMSHLPSSFPAKVKAAGGALRSLSAGSGRPSGASALGISGRPVLQVGKV